MRTKKRRKPVDLNEHCIRIHEVARSTPFDFTLNRINRWKLFLEALILFELKREVGYAVSLVLMFGQANWNNAVSCSTQGMKLNELVKALRNDLEENGYMQTEP